MGRGTLEDQLADVLFIVLRDALDRLEVAIGVHGPVHLHVQDCAAAARATVRT